MSLQVIAGELATSRATHLRGNTFVLVADSFKASPEGVRAALHILSAGNPEIDGLAGFAGPSDDGPIAVWVERGPTVVLSHIQGGSTSAADEGGTWSGVFDLFFPVDTGLDDDVTFVLAWPARTPDVARAVLTASELRAAAGRTARLSKR